MLTSAWKLFYSFFKHKEMEFEFGDLSVWGSFVPELHEDSGSTLVVSGE